MFDLDWLRETLLSDITLKYYPEIHSTNTEALRLIGKTALMMVRLLLQECRRLDVVDCSAPGSAIPLTA